MKKSLLLAGIAASIFSTSANAIELKPYVGLDYSYSKASTNDIVVEGVQVPNNLFEDSFNSLSVNLGTKFNKNFGIEAFYQKSDEEKGEMSALSIAGHPIATDRLETSFEAYGIDAQGYLPLNKKVDLIGSLGLGQYDFEIKGFGYKESEDELGYRLGAGAQYNFNENIAIRGMIRHVLIDSDAVDDITEFSAGVRYTF